jgi:L-alanine-DL-glutamate epimerase-like enolase superfamily enzyme
MTNQGYKARIVRIAVERGKRPAEDRIQASADNGVSGFGEGLWAEAVLSARPELLMGRSPFEAEAIYDDLTLLAGEPPGGLDIALWDLAGKLMGAPSAALIGKTWRQRIRTLRRIQLEPPVREWNAAGGGVLLTLPSAEAALETAACLEKTPPEFWETPLPENDLDGYRTLRNAVALPLAAGGRRGMDTLLGLLQNRLVDIAIPDVARYGLTGLRRLAYYCWLFRVRGAVACSGSDLALAAAVTGAAGYVRTTNAMAAPEPFIVTPAGAGTLHLPAGAGLGTAVTITPDLELEVRV